ncbi:MAG: hypothetical protein HZB91_11380 [Elusimicrobia bacterium]|nr:hypothetical protein [Elusimicrobiota bacterium]
MRHAHVLRPILILAVAACIPAWTWAGPRVAVPAVTRGTGYAIPSYVSGAAMVGTRFNPSLNGVPSLPVGTGLQGLGAPQVGLPSLPAEAALLESKETGKPAGLVDAVKTAVQSEAPAGSDLRSTLDAESLETPKTDAPAEAQQDWAERSFEKLKGGNAPVPVSITEVGPSVNPSGLSAADPKSADPSASLPKPSEPAVSAKGKAATFLDSRPRLKESLLMGLELFGPLIGTAFFGAAIYLSFTYLPLFAAIGAIPLTIQLMAKPMAAFHRFQDARLEQRYAEDRGKFPAPEIPGEELPGDQTPPATDPVETPQPAPSEPVEPPQPVPPAPPAEEPGEAAPAARLSQDARMITGPALRREAEKAAARAARIDPAARLVEARIDLEDASSHWVFVFHSKDRVITVWQKRIGVKPLKGARVRTLETRRLSHMGKLENVMAQARRQDPDMRFETARIVRTRDDARYDLVER